METLYIYVGIALFISCVLMIYAYIMQQNKKKKKMISEIHQYAKADNSEITSFEIINNSIIGIDKNMNKIFYIKNDKNVNLKIDLNNIKIEIINETSTNVKQNNSVVKVIEKIAIDFIPSDSKQRIISINLFDIENGDIQLLGEPQFAEKWTKIINEQLSLIKSNSKLIE